MRERKGSPSKILQYVGAINVAGVVPMTLEEYKALARGYLSRDWIYPEVRDLSEIVLDLVARVRDLETRLENACLANAVLEDEAKRGLVMPESLSEAAK